MPDDELIRHIEQTYREVMGTTPLPQRLNELLGTWLPESEEERKLRELAETYHTGCEAYDRRVCSGTSPRTGNAIPLTPDEMRLINRHAREMRDTIIWEGQHLGFSREQVEQAIRQYSR